ncbi:MAG: hypothetical protein OXM54_01265 [Acidimicrobiaceae bacterium]|nr:hypothetical protein [Acidimicrobiaceae bacterium]
MTRPRATRPRPVPAPCDDFQGALRDAKSWRTWVIPWINWLAVNAAAVFAAFLVIMAVFIGDWDNPIPPPRVGVWAVGGLAAAVTVWVAWRMRLRSLRLASVGAPPLHAWFWHDQLEGAYSTAAFG